MLKLLAAVSRDHRFTDTFSKKGGAPQNMCEVLDRVEQRGIELGRTQGMAIGMRNHARQTALNLCDRAGIIDPALVAGLVEVEVEQVKRWFAENPKH